MGRIAVIVPSILLVFSWPALAKGNIDPAAAAEKVLAAFEAQDGSALAALAGRDSPDPWLVADVLLRRGKRDAALAFARAAPRTDTEKLPDFVREAEGEGTQAEARDAHDRAWARLGKREGAEALAILEGVEATGVLGVQIEWARGLALMVARRHEESVAVLKHAAVRAEEMGWLSVSASCWSRAGRVAYEGLGFDAALASWTEFLRVAEARKDPIAIAGALTNIGIVHEAQGRLEEARGSYERALGLMRQEGNRRGEAFVLGNLGIIHTKLSQHDDALACYARSLVLSRELGHLPGVVNALSNTGLVHDQRGHFLEAVRCHEEALEAARRVGDPRQIASVLSNLGRAWHAIGDEPRALELQERALNLRRRVGDLPGLATSLGSVAAVCAALGENRRALRCHEQALALHRKVGDPFGEALDLLNMSILRTRLGDLPLAIASAAAALEAYRKVGSIRGESNALSQLAHLRTDLGEPKRAIALLTEALRTQEKIGDREGQATSLLQLAAAHARLGDDARSEELVLEALDLCREAGLRGKECVCLDDLARHAERREARDRALELRRKALEIVRAQGHRLGLMQQLNALALLHVSMGKLPEAERCQTEAAELIHEFGSSPMLVTCLAAQAVIQVRRGDHEAALVSVREALELLSGELRGLSAEEGAAVREARSGVFDLGVLAALGAQDPAGLCFVLESGRAGALLESLDAHARLREDLIPVDLRNREAAARARLARATAEHARARRAGTVENARELRKELETAREDVRQAVREIQRSAKAAAGLLYPRADSLETIQARLREEEALVLYESSLSAALVVTRKAARIVALEGEIADPCDDLVGVVGGPLRGLDLPAASRSGTDAVRAAEDLSRRLVAPLDLGPGTTRLLVSPAGRLAYVPFGLLVGDREVVYVPSGTTYGVLLQDRGRRGEDVLALGDPDYGTADADHPLVARARGRRLSPLPATREEARAIGDVLLLGRQATEAEFGKALGKRPRWRSVHFGCHGLVDAERPTLSSLALARDPENDGFLTCLDVFRMRVPADLVVLSACETGRGRIYEAEGIVGLTSAFMTAGAPRVLCSLWKVDDRATRALMERFYELWNPEDGGEGLPTATALKKAQEFVRDHPDHPEWKHPYYWAAWVLWGRPD